MGTIGWAKQVPGFAHLSLSDQMNLLHGCWLEVLLLSVAQRSAIGGRVSLNDQIKVRKLRLGQGKEGRAVGWKCCCFRSLKGLPSAAVSLNDQIKVRK